MVRKTAPRVGIAGVVVGTIIGELTNAGVGTAVSVATGLTTFTIVTTNRSSAEEWRTYGAT